jgi:hypothetical protein
MKNVLPDAIPNTPLGHHQLGIERNGASLAGLAVVIRDRATATDYF